ncbi:MAG: hypothetical protein OEZ00_05730 [Dehalococcoidia bacterium]|nr:hypothetical protein [Dehalococcoidia bacterium]
MPVDLQREMGKLHGALGGAQSVIKTTFYEWRQTALELAGPDANPLDIILKFWEIAGKDVGKNFFPALNMLKGEEAFMVSLARALAGTGIANGAVVKVEKGENPNEVFIKWERCPWPTFAKRYGASMEEDLLGCDKFLQTIVDEVNLFFNTNFKLETQKAIPKGQGVCLRRLYKE